MNSTLFTQSENLFSLSRYIILNFRNYRGLNKRDWNFNCVFWNLLKCILSVPPKMTIKSPKLDQLLIGELPRFWPIYAILSHFLMKICQKWPTSGQSRLNCAILRPILHNWVKIQTSGYVSLFLIWRNEDISILVINIQLLRVCEFIKYWPNQQEISLKLL